MAPQHSASLGPKYTAGPGGGGSSTSIWHHSMSSLLLKQADGSRVLRLRITGRLQKLLGIEPGSSKHLHFMASSGNFMRTTISQHHLSCDCSIMYQYATYVITRWYFRSWVDSSRQVSKQTPTHADVQSHWSLWSLCMRQKFGMPNQHNINNIQQHPATSRHSNISTSQDISRHLKTSQDQPGFICFIVNIIFLAHFF